VLPQDTYPLPDIVGINIKPQQELLSWFGVQTELLAHRHKTVMIGLQDPVPDAVGGPADPEEKKKHKEKNRCLAAEPAGPVVQLSADKLEEQEKIDKIGNP